MTTGKTIALTIQTFIGKVMSLLFNTPSRSVIAFLPRSKHLLISWLQSPSAGILEPPKINSVTVSIVSPCICYEVTGPDAMILAFWLLSFKPAFSPSSFTFIKRLFSSSLLSAISEWSRSVVSNSLQPQELYSSWNSPGQNNGVGGLYLFQGIFPTQGSNPGLPHCRCTLYQLSHKGSPRILEWVDYPFSSRYLDPRIEPGSPALQADSLPTKLSGKLFWHKGGRNF